MAKKMSEERKKEMRAEIAEKAQKAAKRAFSWLAKVMGILTLAVIIGKIWMHAHASWLSILGSAILTAIFAIFAILDFKDIFDWIAEKWDYLVSMIKKEDDDEESESEPEPKAKAKEVRSESESEEDDDEDVSKPAPKPVEKKPAPKPAEKKPISIEEAFDLELDGLTF